jgi:hypothetical protein
VKLTNFELDSTVGLTGLDQAWDLHNCVDFAGLELVPEEGAARMRWTVMTESPYREMGFNGGNPATSCAIRFDGVSEIAVRRVADGTHPTDSRTLHQVTLVAPLESTPADALKLGIRIPSVEADARLLFEFMDGFDVEVAAESATLVADG